MRFMERRAVDPALKGLGLPAQEDQGIIHGLTWGFALRISIKAFAVQPNPPAANIPW